ncbi:MAG: diacylglycerol kinase family lipid kinase [Tissierellia bacterium]|nr:diacylglycerol kinase family lipid kinase [Tissierellia bacterium]
MFKTKIIVNPSSGRQGSESKIDRLLYLLHSNGYNPDICFTQYGSHAEELAIEAESEGCDTIIVSGGDGTVNEVINGMMKSNSKARLAILSQGTVNDFAGYMGLPRNADELFQVIVNKKMIPVDVGLWDDRYFINVAAGGLLTEVAHEVEDDLKAIWGKAAYYVEGARRLIDEIVDPTGPFSLKIESPAFTGDVEAMMFLISNSKSIGGFKLMAPNAEVYDGLFDVLIIKSLDFFKLAPLVINSIAGLHVKDKSVLYFKTNKLKLSSDREITVDLDGERGNKLPGNLKVIPNSINLLVP